MRLTEAKCEQCGKGSLELTRGDRILAVCGAITGGFLGFLSRPDLEGILGGGFMCLALTMGGILNFKKPALPPEGLCECPKTHGPEPT